MPPTNVLPPINPDDGECVRTYQYVQEARSSVAHITTRTRAPAGHLLLDPGSITPGTGSGFVWDSSGHIVTNFHVIQNATEVKVTLSDQYTGIAEVVGTDPNNDVAVLKLPGSSVGTTNTPLAVGTSHDLMVGQRVFAIGNPFGLDQTLTGAPPNCARIDREIPNIQDYFPGLS